jgi:alanine-synthesizing transaminase
LNLRRELASKYFRKYGVRLDPETEALVCLGSKEGFSHMCLALMGPGDTAMIPAPYFPVHMYGVVLAAGNVVALEVADSDKFLSNIAYTCQHFYPKPKLLIINYPHNPSTVTVEQDFFT